MRCGSDPNQLKLTDFFSVVNKVVQLLETDEHHELKSAHQTKNLSPLLKQLMINAEKNVQRLPKQRRHDELLKKFATSLLIFAGPISYDFVHQKMPEAIPSLRTVQRLISVEYKSFREGEFRFDELAVCT